MSLANSEVAAVVEHCAPTRNLIRGELLAVHQNYKIEDTEQYQLGRNRVRGSFVTPMFADFKTYIAASITTGKVPVYVSRDDVKAVAVLNDSETGYDQGHCDHTATLQLEKTVVWKKLNELNGQRLNQRSFANLLDDWASVFKATSEDGEVIEIKDALLAVRNMKVDSNNQVDSQVNNTRTSRGTLETVEAKAVEGKLPTYFEVQDTAYIGLGIKTIKLRLSVNTQDQAPSLTLQIVKQELLIDEIAQEFKLRVAELLPEQQVLIGTFKA
ncbi:DUF2303 family protein [Acinetobacter sp. Ac_5812]|uniref:DUF2303 family protein n=1 Tax=Acinetobacter sp. Ac_5812 TaxID=1848937 RepID=UPI001490214F|nr:DUF2303 family protein [Acinetobacter sp. Ac_5812]NNP70443.1 hypothetical protein [Acinetobacter sp. Ac_5812]